MTFSYCNYYFEKTLLYSIACTTETARIWAMAAISLTLQGCSHAGRDHPEKFQALGTRDNLFNTARYTFSQINSISALFLTMYGHVKSWHSYTVIKTFCNDYSIDFEIGILKNWINRKIEELLVFVTPLPTPHPPPPPVQIILSNYTLSMMRNDDEAFLESSWTVFMSLTFTFTFMQNVY